MIVSASYRTDIPALYGEWFMNRLTAGHCRVVNPYSGRAVRIPLDRERVDGIVFWTKNLAPFVSRLAEVRARGFPFVVHYTITNYPALLERSVPEARQGVRLFRALAADFGPRVAVWRYDPVLLTTATPTDWHLANFAGLAKALSGAADEVVVSFAHVYRKTARNLDRAARDLGFDWKDPGAEAKRALLLRLCGLAAEWGFRLTLCTQPALLGGGLEPARCIDAERLSAAAGRRIDARVRGNREGCLCHESRDVGDYDSCTLGCVYCYAVSSRAAAKRRRKRHDPQGEFLVPPA